MSDAKSITQQKKNGYYGIALAILATVLLVAGIVFIAVADLGKASSSYDHSCNNPKNRNTP